MHVFTAFDQKLVAAVVTDEIFSLAIELTSNSSFSGFFEGEESINLSLDDTSFWVLVADSRPTPSIDLQRTLIPLDLA